MREPLTDEEVDEVEEIACGGPREESIARLEAAAAQLAPGERLRAEVLRTAAELHLQDLRLGEAQTLAEAAVRDGGVASVDPHATLLDVLLHRGDPAAAQVERELRAALRDAPEAATTVHLTAEALFEAAWFAAAARWYSVLLADVDPSEVEDSRWAAPARWRAMARSALGRPLDRFDRAAVEHGFQPWLQDCTFGSGPTFLAWPADELTRLLERWPDLGAVLGSDHDEHRALLDRAVAVMAESDLTGARVTAGSLSALDDQAARLGLDPEHSATRRSLARIARDEGRAVAWTADGTFWERLPQ